MLKAKSSEKFLSPKICKKSWPFRGPGDQGVWIVAIFYYNRHILAWNTSIEPFCVKIGWGVWPLGLWGKSQKVTRGSHRNGVSPLHRACATAQPVIVHMGHKAKKSVILKIWRKKRQPSRGDELSSPAISYTHKKQHVIYSLAVADRSRDTFDSRFHCSLQKLTTTQSASRPISGQT